MIYTKELYKHIDPQESYHNENVNSKHNLLYSLLPPQFISYTKEVLAIHSLFIQWVVPLLYDIFLVGVIRFIDWLV